MALAAALFFALIAIEDGPVADSRKDRAAAMSQQVSVEIQRRGNTHISLKEGRDLAARYTRDGRDDFSLESNLALPLSLCAGDFDQDGVDDLVSGYATASGGLLTLHRGNVDSIFPNSPDAQRRRQAGDFTNAPFLLPARAFETREAADFLGAGDFNADGHLDLVLASRGGSGLEFFSGNGHGSFTGPERISLPGKVTALACTQINRLDGLSDIAVAVASPRGAKALIFESLMGAFFAQPHTVDLSAQATSIITADLEGDPALDIALACGSELVIVKGRIRLAEEIQSDQPEIIRRGFSFSIRSATAGDFTDDSRADIALLSDDGAVHLLSAPKTGKQAAKSVTGWQVKRLAGEKFPKSVSIQTARLSSRPGETMVLLDSTGGRMRVIDSFKNSESRLRLDSSSMIDLRMESDPVVVIGMRLTPDALDDLVILRKGRITPAIALTAPQATFTVMNTMDAGAGSLRDAIDQANMNAGLDTIDFQIGTGIANIAPMSALPTITDAVLIDGTTQTGFTGTPLIGLDGSGLGAVGGGITVSSGNSTVRALSITGVMGVAMTGAAIRLDTSGGNRIENCYIGTDQTGSMPIPNLAHGITIAGGTGNTIGGLVASARNVISANAGNGILIQTTGDGSNNVQGNFIGLEAGGAAPLGNGGSGITVINSPNNTVGGTTNSSRNIISGNSVSGVEIVQAISTGGSATGNLVQKNYIGTDVTGDLNLGNAAVGVAIISASSNTVGGPLGGNVISGNMLAGVSLLAGASSNAVRENRIGVGAISGTSIPNGNGIDIFDSPNNTIGGTVSSGRNHIAGNAGNGVTIIGAGSTGNTVQGNFIGTDVDAAGPLPNAGLGVVIDAGASNNTIGVVGVDAGNVISGNVAGGLFLNDVASTGNTIQNNIIGADSSGTGPIANGGNGITITGATNNTIGGTTAGTANIIAFNNGGHGGVGVISGTGNRVLGNSIFSNTVLGINLGDDGVTLNDAGDGDTGANNRQNFPVITTAMSGGGFTAIQCTLNSRPSTTYRIEFFSSTACNSSGFGEGERFLGSTDVTTDGSGNATINVTLPIGVTLGEVVTATATNPTGDTSEFSQCVAVTLFSCAINCPADQTILTGPNDAGCGTQVSYPAPQIIGTCGTVSCSPPSGSFFQVGTTDVTCTTGVGPNCSFKVMVFDRTSPKITCPADVTANAGAGQSSAVVSYSAPTVTDNCPGATAICSPPSGSAFPLGTSTVQCVARDEAVNETPCFFTVTVRDVDAPTIRCPANIVTTIASGQTSIVVTYPPPVVSDNLPGATASCAPASGASFPIGTTTVTCTAVDTSGNRAMCGFTITVNGGTPTGRVTIDGGKNALEFGAQTPVAPRRKPPKTESPCSFFTIENTGSTPLTLTYVSAVRTGDAVMSGKITDANERGTYTLSTVSSEQGEQEVPPGTRLTVGVRQSVRFCLRFDPLIPSVQTNTNNLPAPSVIPDVITSRCNFTIEGGAQLSVNVVGNVAETLMLINPANPRKKAAVTFARSGNEFILTYSIFDPDLNTNLAKYELLNDSNQMVGQAIEVDLAAAIRQTGLIRGQSFTVEQRFTGANSHPEITGCRLTVTDGEGSVSKTVTSTSSSANSRRRALTLTPPVIKIGR